MGDSFAINMLCFRGRLVFRRKPRSLYEEWPDRMVLYSVFATVKSLLQSSSFEDSFFGHTAEESLVNIEKAITYFHNQESSAYPHEIELEFAPTGPLQELSMSNGWDQVYLKLSEAFDNIKYCLHQKT